jgi:protein involved in polysaccharide export with SLBB domain
VKFLPARLTLSLLLATPFVARGQGMTADSGSAMLAPGDLLRITVWRRPEFSGDFVIAPDSTITHPLYREVKAAGVPLRTTEDRIRLFLSRFETTPAFVISPLLRIFVGGEVRQPSVYNVPPGTTIAQAVALAGGPTDRGILEEVTLVRHQQREMIDVTSSDSRVATKEARSGDQILVARRRNFFLDVLAPSSSVFAAAASVVSIIIQLRR